MPDRICENCGFKTHEMEPQYAGPVLRYRSCDANGELIETLCEFCVNVEIAAGIPHEVIPDDSETVE